MKRGHLIILICMFLLVSFVNGEVVALAGTSTSVNAPADIVEIERVYGEDYSHLIFNAVSVDMYRDLIIKLTENGSRPVGSPNNLGEHNIAARNWIVDELQRLSDGRIEVEVLGEYASVVGRLPGYLPVNVPALMVGGHYDSVSSAPGANDDGTGVATALELARVMSTYNWPLDIYFGFWNAEEIGLIGSTEVARIFKDRDVKLLAYYNVDMLLVPSPVAPPSEKILMAYPVGYYHEGAYWAHLTKVLSQNFGEGFIRPIISNEFSGFDRSDHWPFVQQGYIGLFAHESGFEYDTAYHTSMDTWDNPLYDYHVAIEAVKAIGAAMAFTMARTYGEPTTHDLRFTLIPSHTRNYSVVISTPTTINVTCRWWGGGTAISLFDSSNLLLEQMVDYEASPWERNLVISHDVSSSGIYRLEISNTGGTLVGHEVGLSYETDIDGNDVLDSKEFWFDNEYFSMDSDLDTISDAQEMLIGTNRNSNDSDSDTIPDSWEITHGLDPIDPSDAFGDEDSDGVMNAVEYLYNCNPHDSDSDSDAMPDLWEIENNLDPTIDDSLGDPDHDAVTNVQEYEDGTDPHYAEFRPERLIVPAIAIGTAAPIVIVVYAKLRKRV